MGISVSTCSKDPNTEDLFKLVREVEACQETPTRTPESQRNDNATKLAIQHERVLLRSPTPLSSSSGLSVRSVCKPRLEHSPKLHRAQQDVFARTRIREADNYWVDQTQRSKLEEVQNQQTQTISHPPWRSSNLSSPPLSCYDNGYQSHRPRYPRHSFPHPILSQRQGLQNKSSTRTRTRPVNSKRSDWSNGRNTGSSASLACPYALRLQTGEAHLRRCSAAQQVVAKNPDILDSISVDQCGPRFNNQGSVCNLGSKRPSIGRALRQSGRRRQERISATEIFTVPQGDDFSRISDFEDTTEPSVIESIEVSPLAKQHQQEQPKITSSHDDAFPLRYVFYVEDTSNSIRAFATGSQVLAVARDTHCRIYFHAQCNQSMPFGQRRLDAAKSVGEQATCCRTVQPTLYYFGKRVRPVTVAARGLTELRRFLNVLDHLYPEFEAGSHLEKDLVLTPIIDGRNREM